MSTMTGNPTYNLTAMLKEEILQNHHSVMLTFGIFLPEEDIDLPKLYWIPKLHKNPYKQRYIAGSAKCSTKPLSQILTRILTAVKESLQKYCDTAYARSVVNQMWILKKKLQRAFRKPKGTISSFRQQYKIFRFLYSLHYYSSW